MDLNGFLQAMNEGREVEAGSELHLFMHTLSEEARRVTSEINGEFHTAAEIRMLMRRLTLTPIDESFSMFPPFYTDHGRNITFGRNVFVNSGCCFQDQGGIWLGDGALIGHRVTLATLNHGETAESRGDLRPAPIVVGKNAWIGAGATVVPGVTIGDGAIVAAGAVVTRDVAPLTVVGGIPARRLRDVRRNGGPAGA